MQIVCRRVQRNQEHGAVEIELEQSYMASSLTETEISVASSSAIRLI